MTRKIVIADFEHRRNAQNTQSIKFPQATATNRAAYADARKPLRTPPGFARQSLTNPHRLPTNLTGNSQPRRALSPTTPLGAVLFRTDLTLHRPPLRSRQAPQCHMPATGAPIRPHERPNHKERFIRNIGRQGREYLDRWQDHARLHPVPAALLNRQKVGNRAPNKLPEPIRNASKSQSISAPPSPRRAQDPPTTTQMICRAPTSRKSTASLAPQGRTSSRKTGKRCAMFVYDTTTTPARASPENLTNPSKSYAKKTDLPIHALRQTPQMVEHDGTPSRKHMKRSRKRGQNVYFINACFFANTDLHRDWPHPNDIGFYQMYINTSRQSNKHSRSVARQGFNIHIQHYPSHAFLWRGGRFWNWMGDGSDKYSSFIIHNSAFKAAVCPPNTRHASRSVLDGDPVRQCGLHPSP